MIMSGNLLQNYPFVLHFIKELTQFLLEIWLVNNIIYLECENLIPSASSRISPKLLCISLQPYHNA